MAQDATGVATAKGIPKFNTAVDPPSGKGSNAQMDAIDTALGQAQWSAGTPLTGQIAQFDGANWNYVNPAGIALIIALGG